METGLWSKLAPATRSTLARLTGLALAVVIVCLPAAIERATTHTRQRRVADEAARRAREGAELARQVLALQDGAVALMAENAAANPRFQVAVRGRVDRDTFADLLATESWWEPYREMLTAISYDGVTFAFTQTEGADGVSVAALVRQVSRSGRAASVIVAGRGGGFLVAARPLRFDGEHIGVLALARRIDGAVLDEVAAGARRAVMLSDGTRALGRGGAEGDWLEPFAGAERRGQVTLRFPSAHAAVVEVAPGLWLWALGRANDVQEAVVTADRSRQKVLLTISLPVALGVAALSLRPRPRRARASAPPLLPPMVAAEIVRAGGAMAPVPLSPSSAAIVRPGPGTRLGRYLLVDQIGIGGMAEVFTAVSFGAGKFRRPFVIKRLRAELDGNAAAVGLFVDEANLASTLVHQNLVPVFDFGEVGGSYYLAEEYVVGRDLGRITTRLCERGDPPLSVNAILHLATEILDGLAYAHDKRDEAGRPMGLVHRDVTPANVIVSERGEVKILDFGIMKARQRVSHTDSGTVRGNVGFMSPEQARCRAVDHRSDLFSTGLLMLYAATGEPTYPGDTFYDLLNAAAAGPGEAQRARIAALPAPLPEIITHALEVDPDRRFQSCAEFSAAIAPHLESGGAIELASRVISLFGEELRAEQERLAGVLAQPLRPESSSGTGA
jgi:hypothetical protein